MSEKFDYNKFGFDNESEFLLLNDICAGNDVTPPSSMEGLLFRLNIEDLDIKIHNSKSDYINYIKKNGLYELYLKVLDMNMFDRMVEIYLHYFNMSVLFSKMTDIYKEELRKAQDLFDTENQLKYTSLLDNLFLLKMNSTQAQDYIVHEVRKRPNLDYEAFLKVIYDFDKSSDGLLIR